MTSHTPSAATLRGRVILGNATVKSEIESINARLETAADNGKTRLVIRNETTMTKSYNYGNWFLVEEFFQYGAALKKGGFTSVTALGGMGAIENKTQKQILDMIKGKGTNVLQRHAEINAVLAHYRKLGYQMHPGNWFDAGQKNNIIWVLNWNNTIMDHITVVDNTLCIGKPDQKGLLGSAEKSGELDSAGRALPIGGYYKPSMPQTNIEFFGLGNKGQGQITVEPADGKLGGTNNLGYRSAAISISEGMQSGEEGAALAAAAGSGLYSMALIADMAGVLGKAIGDLTRTGLFSSEVGQGGEISAMYGNNVGGGGDFATVEGYVNTGDGVTPDIENVPILDNIGAHVATGENYDQWYNSKWGMGTPGGNPLDSSLANPENIGNITVPGGSGSGSTTEGGYDASGPIQFTFNQTRMDQGDWGWWFIRSELRVTGTKGSQTVRGNGFIAKKGRPAGKVSFVVDKNIVGSVTRATFVAVWEPQEGIANADYTSIIQVYAGGKLYKTLTSAGVKALGQRKGAAPLSFDVTSYIAAVVGKGKKDPTDPVDETR
jgi:hypothetical protein